jgi:hypothetical protein
VPGESRLAGSCLLTFVDPHIDMSSLKVEGRDEFNASNLGDVS